MTDAVARAELVPVPLGVSRSEGEAVPKDDGDCPCEVVALRVAPVDTEMVGDCVRLAAGDALADVDCVLVPDNDGVGEASGLRDAVALGVKVGLAESDWLDVCVVLALPVAVLEWDWLGEASCDRVAV